jgi:hypothetical protein
MTFVASHHGPLPLPPTASVSILLETLALLIPNGKPAETVAATAVHGIVGTTQRQAKARYSGKAWPNLDINTTIV